MILVIIIVVAWMIILGPNLLKRRARTVGGISSISHFHHQLRVLEQPGPQPLLTPAYRLRSVDGSVVPPQGAGGAGGVVKPKLSVVGADQLPRPALAFLGRDAAGPDDESTDGTGIPITTGPMSDPGIIEFDVADASGASALSGPSFRQHDGYARHRARRRRRDTLGMLTLFFGTTVLIGFIPGATVAWVLSLVSGLALAGYVALLVRMRQMAEERERKLHYLRPNAGHRDIEGSQGHEPGQVEEEWWGTGDLPVRMNGRYAHPSNQAAVAR